MRIPIDIHYENEPYKIAIREGSNFLLELAIENQGSANTEITSFTGVVHLYDDEDDATTYQFASTTTTPSTRIISFAIAPGDLPAQRAYRSEIVVKDASGNPYAYAKGSVVIRKSILGTVVSALTAGPALTWTTFSSYVGTATSGPYRAGKSITFSANADGSQNIDADAGTLVDLTQGQDFVVVTGLGLTATPKYFDVQILIPTNGSDLPSCYQVLDTVSTDGVRINFDSDISGAGYKIGISPRY